MTPRRLLSRSDDSGSLAISIGSMLVAHAAFIAVAVALPDPLPKPNPTARVVPLRQVEVRLVEEELEEPEPEVTWKEPAPEPAPDAFPPVPEVVALPDEAPLIVEALPEVAPPSDLTFLQPEKLEPERPPPPPRASRTLLSRIDGSGMIALIGTKGGVEGGALGGDVAFADMVSVRPTSETSRHARELKRRLRAAVRDLSPQRGRIALSVVIGPDGEVLRYRQVSSTTSPEVADAMLNALETMEPLEPLGRELTVRVTIAFQ